LFTAHTTGNLVILAARLLGGDPAPIAHILAVPVFVVALFLTRILANVLDRIRAATLLPLLVLQSILLAGATAICVTAVRTAGPATVVMVTAGMLCVAAMAVHNALVRVSLTKSPSTAVMTTNVTTFTMDVAEMMFGRDPDRIAEARDRAGATAPAIAGFLA